MRGNKAIKGDVRIASLNSLYHWKHQKTASPPILKRIIKN